jgi:putative CocE/NonD family hydrolase
MNKMSYRALSLPVLAGTILFLAGSPVHGQALPDASRAFVKTQTMVPMRDGVRLNTAIYVPKDPHESLPFILLRTPYGVGSPRALNSYLKDMAKEGYIFVFQDIRGRFQSEGEFVMCRSPRDKSDPKAIDESTDAYDTIDWLLKNVENNNGRVGALGISYGGWLTAMTLLEPHPALKAISPQASPADMFLGDDFHHNGAFRLSYGLEYVALMESSKGLSSFHFDRYDTFEWYLNLGSLSHVDPKYFHGKMPTWNDFVAHPNYDQFWQKQAFATHLKRVSVPTLNVAGWWDQEDFYGPLKIYELLEKADSDNKNFLVVGPWNHGGWSGGEGTSLGKVEFDSPTAEYFRSKIQAPWFAYFLKDKGQFDQPEALLFETGRNRWEKYDHWPPRRNVTPRPLYLRSAGRLSFEPPADEGDRAFDSYVSDPACPVPYRPRPISATYSGPGWPVWLVQDQRFVHQRPDVLSWETEPLKEDVTVAGEVIAHLFASTSGSDSDWVVKLIDVYPEDYKESTLRGYQLMIGGEVFRGRFHRSFDKPEPLIPNEAVEYAIGLHGSDHCFLKGHKIMVQVQSSWFPIIDRNPQKFVENIFQAKDSDFHKATQHVYRSPRLASHLVLPVVKHEER